MSDVQDVEVPSVVEPAIVGWGGTPPPIRKKATIWDPIVDEVRAKAPEWAEIDTTEKLAANKVTSLRKRYPDFQFIQRETSVWIRYRGEDEDTE